VDFDLETMWNATTVGYCKVLSGNLLAKSEEIPSKIIAVVLHTRSEHRPILKFDFTLSFHRRMCPIVVPTRYEVHANNIQK